MSSGIRTAPPTKEPPPLVARKHSQQSTNTKSGGTKQKPGFTISSNGDEEEDEWVSSEAGSAAVSEDESTDDEPSPERSRTPVEVLKPVHSTQKLQDTAFQAATPRAESTLSRVATMLPQIAVEPQAPAPLKRAPSQIHATDYYPQRQQTETHHRESHSEHTSPTHTHHRHEHGKHASVTRPPSTHSIRTEVPLRPHPLIRGQSYGQGVALGAPTKPTPLAPLTVTSGSQAAQISSSPPGPSTSPTSIKTAYGPDSSPIRPTSVSSAASIATLPSTPLISQKVPDRSRTLSTMSNSSFAALTSLAHLPGTTSRPPTPQQYTSQFPPADSHHNHENMHTLLPPPYLSAHLTVLATRSPIREAFDRVARAKQSARA